MTIDEALPYFEDVQIGWCHTHCCNEDVQVVHTTEDISLLRGAIRLQTPHYMGGPQYVWRSESEMKADPIYQQWLKENA